MKNLSLEMIAKKVERCRLCSLAENRRNTVPGHIGGSKRHLVFIGEAPGFNEDISGEPFVGKSGKILEVTLDKIFGMKREDYSILNSVKCRPPNNRAPSEFEKRCCRPYLIAQLALLSPCLVIGLGKHSCSSVVGENCSLAYFRRFYYAAEDAQVVMLPTYHPAATIYNPNTRELFEHDLSLLGNSNFLHEREKATFKLDIGLIDQLGVEDDDES